MNLVRNSYIELESAVIDKIDDQAKGYKVVLSGEGLALEKLVNLSTAMKIVELAMTGVASNDASKGSGRSIDSEERPNPQGPRVGGETIVEFIKNSEAKRNPDIITAIAYYMRYRENLENFKRDDIKARFRTARIPLPGNFSRDFNLTLDNAIITEDTDEKGSYYLTQTGEEAFNNGFSHDLQRNIKRRSKSSTESTKSKPKDKNSPKKSTRSSAKVLRDLDLTGPGNTQSLDDFYAQYAVTSDIKRNVVFAHYCAEVLKITPVTEDHIMSCYHHLELKLPINMESSLKNSNATSRGGFLMSSNPQDVQLSVQGMNLIRQIKNSN